MDVKTVIVGAGALIHCTSTNRYLFLLRDKGKFSNTWGLVGGKIEHNETILQGLKREIQEELGGEILDAKFLPIEKFTSSNKKFFYHTFLIKVEEEFIPNLNTEHKGFCWVTIDNCPKPTHPGLEKLLNSNSLLQKFKIHQSLKD